MNPGPDARALTDLFAATYGRAPRLFSAPGRVNLIGDHTDYNDGFVLPMAIANRTLVAAAGRDDRRLRCASRNAPGTLVVDLDAPARASGTWTDYVTGTALALSARGFEIRGADLFVDSDVPIGAGLSSSAALEMSIGLALVVLGGSERPDRLELARAGRDAENGYVGAESGIMDQAIVALAEAGHALLIDCRSLATRSLPLPSDVAVVVADSRTKHSLVASDYNLRREECAKATLLFAEHLPGVHALRDVTVEAFEAHANELPDVLRRRARHVVTENARALSFAEAMAQGDVTRAGRLMSESHRSLRDDYEVSCPELDTLVELALHAPGVRGSRMTGGGFGGSTVSLVDEGAVAGVQSALEDGFSARFGKKPLVFATSAMAGAREEPVP
jgi:galactokinase